MSANNETQITKSEEVIPLVDMPAKEDGVQKTDENSATTTSDENSRKRKMIQCDLCNITCYSQVNFENHLAGKVHAKNVRNPPKKIKLDENEIETENGKDGDNESEKVKESIYTLICKYCQETFEGKNKLRTHIKKHHPKSKDTVAQTPDKDHLGSYFIIPVNGYFCKLCQKFYKSDEGFSVGEHFKSEAHQKHLSSFRKVIERDIIMNMVEKNEMLPSSQNTESLETSAASL